MLRFFIGSQRTLRIITFLFATGIFGAWVLRIALKPGGELPQFQPDSWSYIHDAEQRPWVYPLFLQLTADKSSHPDDNDAFPKEKYRPTITYQRIIGVAAIGGLFWTVSYFHWLAPILLLAGMIVGDRLGQLYIVMEQVDSSGSLLSEALLFPWSVTFLILLMSFAHRTSLAKLVFIGLWAFIGGEINPRVLPFGILTMMPFLISYTLTGFSWRQHFKALTPAILFVALVLLKCCYCYSRYEVFSTTPIAGIDLAGAALQFSEKTDVSLFDDNPRLKRVLEESYASPSYDNKRPEIWPVINIYHILFPQLRKEFGENVPEPVFNKMLADISHTLLFKRPANLYRWFYWSITHSIPFYISYRPFFLLFTYLSGIFATIFLCRRRDSLFAVCIGVMVVHFLNTYIANALLGYDPRKFMTSEIYLYILPIFALIPVFERLRSLQFEGKNSSQRFAQRSAVAPMST